MSTRPHQQRIVVGLDDSICAREALRWAAEEAQIRGAHLDVVSVCDAPDGEIVPLSIKEEVVGVHALTEANLRDALDDEGLAPADERHSISARVIDGSVTRCLLEAADGADLLVVGARGHGQVVGVLLGSVSLYCVTHAPCPVVVVRPLR